MDIETEALRPRPDVPLRDEILGLIVSVIDGESGGGGPTADAIMQLLMDRGHCLPGCPPAAVILEDAKQFAERLTLSNLALRLLNMLAWSNVQTPETVPARKWLEDYLEGRNHGPVGKPMLWPARLPGLCHLLTEWGFEATPTMPPYVCRSLPSPTMQRPHDG